MYLEEIVKIAKLAGAKILKIYQASEAHEYALKEDCSPCTKADEASHDVIVTALAKITPHVPIISEEGNYEDTVLSNSDDYWLVDPLDGTKEFLSRNGEFTVNIALIKKGKPILGVVYVPVLAVCYYASSGEGAYKQKEGSSVQRLKVDSKKHDSITIAVSRRHDLEPLERFVSYIGKYNVVSMGSSLKICAVADNTVDIYPRFGPTMAWDIAAAQCVLEEAGGQLLDQNEQPLRYNAKTLKNPKFLAIGTGNPSWAKNL